MDKLFSTIQSLVALGFAGVGIAVFLMVFIMLMRGKPVDGASARLQGRFLLYGFIFAVFCGVMTVVAPLLQPAPVGGPIKLRLAFSPDFSTEKLSPPKVLLPDGSQSDPDKAFEITPAPITVLTVGMDATLAEVASLRTTSAQLANSVADVQTQRDLLATRLPAAAAAPAPVQQNLAASAGQSRALQQNVAASIAKGDFKGAAQLSAQLRASVARTNQPIAAIAQSAAH